MNAITLLKADHKDVERMFKECEAATLSKKRTIFEVINAALETHAWIEETIFYPTLQAEGGEDLVQMVSEGIQEHVDAKCFLGEIGAAAPDGPKFEALLSKLIEDVRHHVKEEEGEMFPAVRKQFSEDSLEFIGDQMEAEKERFQASPETIYG